MTNPQRQAIEGGELKMLHTFYIAKFTGRRRNAEGVRYDITAGTFGETEEAARLALYKSWEHIHGLELEPVGKTIYDACKAAGVETNNHCSDLYIPVNDLTTGWAGAFRPTVQKFQNQNEQGLWFDVPFQFTPYWEGKQGKRPISLHTLDSDGPRPTGRESV